MDIKLKKFSEKQYGRRLFAGWLLVSVTAALALAFRKYGWGDYLIYRIEKIFRISACVLGAVAVIAGMILVFLTKAYKKQSLTRAALKETKADNIKLEFLLAAALLGGSLAVKLFIETGGSQDIYIMGAVVDSAGAVFAFCIKALLIFLVFYGSILLLYRRSVLGTWKETSILYRELCQYQERTPLEKRLHHKLKGSFWLLLVLSAGSIAAIVYRYMLYGENWLIFGVFALLWPTVCFKVWGSNKLLRDTGKLVQQVEILAEGEKIPRELRLSETSVLYETDVRLANIETAMEKSVEKQLQAERLKVDLITNMSHDLKTPLTSMIGYTDLLKAEDLPEAARDYVDAISVKQEHLKEMIQDLFDLSKATSNAEQLQMEKLDMRRLLEQTLGDMEDAVRESDREIRTSFSEEDLSFFGDNGKMYRVVQNLLENALKYSMEHTRIYVTAKREKDKVWAEVKNIASYEMDFAPEEIMERFVRGDKARTTKGHGLGLAIASSYAANMGGQLGVETDGDLFKVTLEFPFAKESEIN